jgi:two-component system OmpR family response regulator
MNVPEILVVDDDPRLRELVRYTLARAGFTVREAADGREALAAVRARAPDLVVLDVLMPELDGISVCRHLRADSDVAVVFLSSRGEAVDRVLALDLGGDDYVTKPFVPSELVSRIRAVLRRTRPAEETPAVVADGPVRLDALQHRAWAADHELGLTVTEFRMLHALLARAGRVILRDDLVRAAYGGPHHVSGRTLDSHVRGVRAKLRAHGADRIETVVGVGFRWARG